MEAAKVATAFWQAVADACEPLDGQPVLGDAFFTRTWAERARDYRLAVEPIDIAEWYRADRHIKGGHYDPMLADEAVDDPRPARYSLLQRQEERVLGAEPGYEVQSSLALAHALEQQLRSQSWAALREFALKLHARTSF